MPAHEECGKWKPLAGIKEKEEQLVGALWASRLHPQSPNIPLMELREAEASVTRAVGSVLKGASRCPLTYGNFLPTGPCAGWSQAPDKGSKAMFSVLTVDENTFLHRNKGHPCPQRDVCPWGQLCGVPERPTCSDHTCRHTHTHGVGSREEDKGWKPSVWLTRKDSLSRELGKAPQEPSAGPGNLISIPPTVAPGEHYDQPKGTLQ